MMEKVISNLMETPSGLPRPSTTLLSLEIPLTV